MSLLLKQLCIDSLRSPLTNITYLRYNRCGALSPIITQLCSKGVIRDPYLYQRRCIAKNTAPPRKVFDFSYTGDAIDGPSPLDLTKPRLKYEEIYKKLEEEGVLNDVVKRLLSLEFADTVERREYRMTKIMHRLGKEPGSGSTEEKFVEATMKLRANVKQVLDTRKDNQAKHRVLALTNKRRALMEELKKSDLDTYNWLTQEFGVRMTFRDPWAIHKSRHKRSARVNAARAACLKEKKRKLNEVKDRLAEERKEFDTCKQQELPGLIKELEQLGVDTNKPIDDVLESIGLQRTAPEITTKVKARRQRYKVMMVGFGKIKEQNLIRGITPDRQ